MEATPGSGARNELFQKLKPPCVQMSKLAIRESGDIAAHKELFALSGQIFVILNDQVAANSLALDEKLAEYVFFPLSHVFRQMTQFPMPLIENCLKCLNLLIVNGWKSRISSKLVQQLFSLLAFVIDRGPGSRDKREKSEEILLEAFRTQTALLNVASASQAAAAGLSDPQAIPDLGHGISVMTDAVVDGQTPEIQKEALGALVAVYRAIREHAALANFLPGTISSIAKVLSAPARYRKLVLARCIEAMQVVLTRVLGDLHTRKIRAKQDEGENAEGREAEEAADANEKANTSPMLSPAWLKATVARVKTALSIAMKLRAHEASEVQYALERLCICLLDECHSTLSNCTAILVETAMILDKGTGEMSISETTLSHLVTLYPELGESARTTVYNWMSKLPFIMQSSDESVKETAMHNFSKGIKMLESLHIESSVLDDSIPSTLRDSVISLITTTRGHPANTTSTPILLLEEAGHAGALSSDSPFRPVLLAHEGQRRLRGEIMDLLQTISASPQHAKIAHSLLENARETNSSVDRVTALWLCFELSRAAHSSAADVGALLDVSAFEDPSGDMDVVLSDLYTFSLLLLDSHNEVDRSDWRLEAIALEVVAYTAQKSNEAFRPELIDVLFPVATLLGSDNAHLRQHAITTLNIMATSCRYDSVSELIINNVDYMVNSISLRLNTLDISPSSAQVLLMMVRLSGPRLIPFLDDVVESIFSALENYHGYPAFVESLFSVLKEVVEQASKADGRLLTDGERSMTNHKKEPRPMEGLNGLVEFLEKRKTRMKDEMEPEEAIGGHPTAPWRSEGPDDDSVNEQQVGDRKDDEKPPNSPTYRLLEKITMLTQHYMTSPMPTLRRSLLELLTAASPVLSADENSFLPLVNAVWPVVITRLRDSEAFVTIEACRALSGLCKAAGDFLSTRFKTEWWDWLGDWCRGAKQQSSTSGKRPSARLESRGQSPLLLPSKDIVLPFRTGNSMESKATSGDSGSGGLGQYASSAKIWEAVSKLLTSIVSYVRVDDEMFDEILDLLAESMERDAEVREALEVVNSDAVWLKRYERGLVEWDPAEMTRLMAEAEAEADEMPRS